MVTNLRNEVTISITIMNNISQYEMVRGSSYKVHFG